MKIVLNTVRTHLKNIYAKLYMNFRKEGIAKVLSDHISL
jgi:DNA-binding CsgD family transcriptional regulator